MPKVLISDKMDPRAAAIGRGEPQPVEEARIARADMVEGRRELMPRGVVENGEHGSPV